MLSITDFTINVEPFVTGWNRALEREIEIEVRSSGIPVRNEVKVVSLPVQAISNRLGLKSRSFFFVPPPCDSAASLVEEKNKRKQNTQSGSVSIFQDEESPNTPENSNGELVSNETLENDELEPPFDVSSSGQTDSDLSFVPQIGNGVNDLTDQTDSVEKNENTLTRFRIPPDAIKIEDRLNYILQPPLESILALPTLEMPFEPFPYQRAGIAFLYGAHFAILADEMGLGKTMQAITTVRLLLRAGEVKNVLFVCPKPLVTNWKREFDFWAPEVNVQVIEGGPHRRKWLWQLEGVPVRIANYELLHRDREYYDCPRNMGGPMFDLVVLDESQRIKNKSSVTSEAARAIPRKRNWALTGTPVENSQEDLVGIFEFLSSGFLESGLRPTEISGIVGEHILR
ncbi:MAG: DEAD/DEAH box helicase, partial [Thermoguttaceae bacterium]